METAKTSGSRIQALAAILGIVTFITGAQNLDQLNAYVDRKLRGEKSTPGIPAPRPAPPPEPVRIRWHDATCSPLNLGRDFSFGSAEMVEAGLGDIGLDRSGEKFLARPPHLIRHLGMRSRHNQILELQPEDARADRFASHAPVQIGSTYLVSLGQGHFAVFKLAELRAEPTARNPRNREASLEWLILPLTAPVGR